MDVAYWVIEGVVGFISLDDFMLRNCFDMNLDILTSGFSILTNHMILFLCLLLDCNAWMSRYLYVYIHVCVDICEYKNTPDSLDSILVVFIRNCKYSWLVMIV